MEEEVKNEAIEVIEPNRTDAEATVDPIVENNSDKRQNTTNEKANNYDNNISISREIVDDLDSSSEIENLKKIEAAMFISGRWLSMQELITLTDLNPILIRQLIDKLKEKYNEESAVEILNKENDWKMDVKPEHVNMINKLATGSAEFSKAEQETLAVIAYKQPVKQSVIIKIRGNKAYEHIKNFVSLGLVKAKKAGHTQELSLSEDFYDYFHVSGSDDPEHPRNSSEISAVSGRDGGDEGEGQESEEGEESVKKGKAEEKK
jgi:segregation and condensation protein B